MLFFCLKLVAAVMSTPRSADRLLRRGITARTCGARRGAAAGQRLATQVHCAVLRGEAGVLRASQKRECSAAC